MKSISKWLGVTIDDRYVVDQFLDEGGMNRVFLATDRHLDCDVVIKMPHEDFVSEALTTRFAKETAALVRLRHPNIVPIHNVGTMDGIPYLVLEYLAGGDLRKRFDQNQTAEQRRMHLRQWFPVVVNALTFIHEHGYVHRDVKPSNILFDESSQPYLADFDITKTSEDDVEQGIHDGTPAYMAPEVPRGEITPAADQYALAIMVYEQLSGSRPFAGASATELMVKHASEEAKSLKLVAPNVPLALSAAVMRALNKTASNRFPSCRAFATAVMSALGDCQEAEPTHSAVEKSSPAPFVVAGVVAMALSLLVLTRGCG